MRPTAKLIFWICVVMWGTMLLPYVIPALNTIEPKIAGLPFTVIWQYLILAFHIALCFYCSKYVWDPFDGKKGE